MIFRVGVFHLKFDIFLQNIDGGKEEEGAGEEDGEGQEHEDDWRDGKKIDAERKVPGEKGSSKAKQKKMKAIKKKEGRN